MSITEAGSTLAPSATCARRLRRGKVAAALARLGRPLEVRVVPEGIRRPVQARDRPSELAQQPVREPVERSHLAAASCTTGQNGR
jgi:hypothetical protein